MGVCVLVECCCFPTGVYGDVQRVKILYNKKDSALIQMSEPHQAHLGKYAHFPEQYGLFLYNCLKMFLLWHRNQFLISPIYLCHYLWMLCTLPIVHAIVPHIADNLPTDNVTGLIFLWLY
jgi:hypothetical protein